MSVVQTVYIILDNCFFLIVSEHFCISSCRKKKKIIYNLICYSFCFVGILFKPLSLILSGYTGRYESEIRGENFTGALYVYGFYRPLPRWRHFTITSIDQNPLRFPFIFKFGNLSGESPYLHKKEKP